MARGADVSDDLQRRADWLNAHGCDRIDDSEGYRVSYYRGDKLIAVDTTPDRGATWRFQTFE